MGKITKQELDQSLITQVEKVDNLSLDADNITLDSSDFNSTNVKEGLEELFQNVSNGKELIASAISDQGVQTSGSDTFAKIAENIRSIPTEQLTAPSWSAQINTVTATFPPSTNFNQYRIAGGSWQSSNTFSGLNPATSYTFEARVYNNGEQIGNIQDVTSTSPKADQSVSTPSSVSWSSQINTVTATVAAVSGATHYRVNNGTWQASRALSGLSPVTNYNFQARKEATSSLNEAISGNRNSTSPRANRSAPSAPTASNIQHDRVTIAGASGTQVRQGSGSWFNSPRTFTGLNPATSYSFYARYPQTTTHNTSAQSSARTITTEWVDTSGAPGPNILISGDRNLGFFGETSTSDLISGDDLASSIGLTDGRAFNNTSPWFKFVRNDNIIYVARRTFRWRISWNHINARGAVTGTNVSIGGKTYKVRLLSSGEWNTYIYGIASGFEPDLASYSANDLGINPDLNGNYTWTSTPSASRYVLRGYSTVSLMGYKQPATYGTTLTGWRPVLELL